MSPDSLSSPEGLVWVVRRPFFLIWAANSHGLVAELGSGRWRSRARWLRILRNETCRSVGSDVKARFLRIVSGSVSVNLGFFSPQLWWRTSGRRRLRFFDTHAVLSQKLELFTRTMRTFTAALSLISGSPISLSAYRKRFVGG